MKLYSATVNGPQAESSEQDRSWILTGGKKPEKWLKVSCLLTGRTNTVRLLSLSVQERITPPQVPELRTPFSALEARRGEKEDRWEEPKRGREGGHGRGGVGVTPGGWTESSFHTQGSKREVVQMRRQKSKTKDNFKRKDNFRINLRKVIKPTQSQISRSQMKSYDMVLYYNIVTALNKSLKCGKYYNCQHTKATLNI